MDLPEHVSTEAAKLNKEKFLAYLREKWKEAKCPYCQGTSFAPLDLIWQIVPFRRGNPVIAGGQALPLAFVVCNTCEALTPVPALGLGIIAEEPPEGPR